MPQDETAGQLIPQGILASNRHLIENPSIHSPVRYYWTNWNQNMDGWMDERTDVQMHGPIAQHIHGWKIKLKITFALAREMKLYSVDL